MPVRRPLRRGLGRLRIAKAALAPAPLPARTLDCSFARNEYGTYCVPRSARHRPEAQAILQSRVWEADTLRFMRGIPGDVIHAGAFFGDFLPALAAREGMVWAFEPNRESFRCAQITALLNDLQNVTLVNAALSDRSGEATLVTGDRLGRAAGSSSWLRAEAPAGRSHETVALLTIDETVPGDRQVGVLGLDVEGHEEQALAGALQTIERCRPLLILETLPSQEWLAEHLPAYRVTRTVNVNKVLEATARSQPARSNTPA